MNEDFLFRFRKRSLPCLQQEFQIGHFCKLLIFNVGMPSGLPDPVWDGRSRRETHASYIRTQPFGEK